MVAEGLHLDRATIMQLFLIGANQWGSHLMLFGSRAKKEYLRSHFSILSVTIPGSSLEKIFWCHVNGKLTFF